MKDPRQCGHPRYCCEFCLRLSKPVASIGVWLAAGEIFSNVKKDTYVSRRQKVHVLYLFPLRVVTEGGVGRCAGWRGSAWRRRGGGSGAAGSVGQRCSVEGRPWRRPPAPAAPGRRGASASSSSSREEALNRLPVGGRKEVCLHTVGVMWRGRQCVVLKARK